MLCDRNNEYFPVVTILETGGGNLTGYTAAVFSNVPLFMILWYDEERFRGLKLKTRGVHTERIFVEPMIECSQDGGSSCVPVYYS